MEHRGIGMSEMERLRRIEAAAKRAMGNALRERQPHRYWARETEWSYVVGESDGRKLKEALYDKAYPDCFPDSETPMLRLAEYGEHYEYHPWRD